MSGQGRPATPLAAGCPAFSKRSRSFDTQGSVLFASAGNTAAASNAPITGMALQEPQSCAPGSAMVLAIICQHSCCVRFAMPNAAASSIFSLFQVPTSAHSFTGPRRDFSSSSLSLAVSGSPTLSAASTSLTSIAKVVPFFSFGAANFWYMITAEVGEVGRIDVYCCVSSSNRGRSSAHVELTASVNR